MNYYQFHINDWISHTSHLSPIEDLIYRRLLDYYYDTESPIPVETQPVIRRLRLGSEADLVAGILQEFFILQDDGWHNLRADEEIAQYNLKADRARSNGKKGGRPKKNKKIRTQNQEETKPVTAGLQNETQPKANQEPRTINQEPKEKGKKRFSPPSLEDVAAYCKERGNQIDPQAFIDFYQSKDWMVGKNRMKDWQASVRTWERRNNHAASSKPDKHQAARNKTTEALERHYGTECH